MELKDLKTIVEKGIKTGRLEFIGRARTYHDLDRIVLMDTGNTADDYEYLILLPVIAKDGYREKGIMDVYGKLSSG